MKKTRSSLTERKGIGLKQNQTSSQRKLAATNPRLMRKNNSVNVVNTRSNKEQKAKEKVSEESTIPAKETDLETPDQSIDRVEQKTTETTPMPNVEQREKKTKELSPIANVDETTNNTTEAIKDDPQTKTTSFTEWFAAMVGMITKEKEEVITMPVKSKTFGTVSAITTEFKQDKEQVTQEATANQEKQTMESKVPSLELGDFMAKLEQIDKS